MDLAALAPAQPFTRIYFDWDSTLSAIEGMDALAERARARGLAVGDIESLTRAAMEGTLALEAIYELRLARLHVRREDEAWLAERYASALVPGAAECVGALLALGKEAHVLSGGLRPAILPAAARLGVHPERVHAVLPRYDAAGLCVGVEAEPALWCDEGKRVWLARHEPDPSSALFVGDGENDLCAAATLERFVGFGGIAKRPHVCEQSDLWFETPNLLPLLCAALTLGEQEQLLADPTHSASMRRAQAAARSGVLRKR